MDHFLWARNPLKKIAPTGLQGYIIDTVKGCWFEVHVFQQARKPDLHKLSLIAGTGNKQQDYHSADRASRWYNSILIARKIKEVKIEVDLIRYVNDNTLEPVPSIELSAQPTIGYGVFDEAKEAFPDAQNPSVEAPASTPNEATPQTPVISLKR
jgi:hypothetical protein